ncbi:inner membrane protein import complex subunit Tim54-domain-containing protein [Bombardia bombarda]|uniref:Mitochondrial import inner membrane translocase subunit TIM54 n=1 Tax=Bombardia bombarda TaxID=252184 RepID=A0AA40CFG8_9PEZI|nr:inner membrane protein import complex subunit Tim54-domain-containing protein [Bombardia bombarda]
MAASHPKHHGRPNTTATTPGGPDGGSSSTITGCQGLQAPSPSKPSSAHAGSPRPPSQAPLAQLDHLLDPHNHHHGRHCLRPPGEDAGHGPLGPHSRAPIQGAPRRKRPRPATQADHLPLEPPGDGLRVAQDHYTEYVKPILAASGLDWEFVQGRREGDVRAVVAERVRKARRTSETSEDDAANPDREPTKDEFIEQYRKAQGIQEYDGVRGDVVIGRHTWKEYIRGLHEGWLGPLTAPPEPTTASSASESLPAVDAQLSPEDGSAPQDTPAEDKPAVAAEGEKNPEEETPKPKRPLQPKPYNTPADYPSSSLPPTIPAELGPVAPICEPHILGFLNTPLRLYRFFNRRALADDIGREVAAVCLCTYREFRQSPYPELDSSDRLEYEQVRELAGEEKDWLKSVWKEDKPPKEGDEPSETTEKVWSKPIVLDPRIATHMRRFEILPEDEARARQIVVPEEEVEGWTKGKLRQVWRWGRGQFVKKPLVPSEDKDVD